MNAHTPSGRSPLNWLVMNADGKLLAVLDSESEAHFFTRNRGHASGASCFKAPCDYASAPDLLAALERLLKCCEAQPEWSDLTDRVDGDGNSYPSAPWIAARAAIAKATGKN